MDQNKDRELKGFTPKLTIEEFKIMLEAEDKNEGVRQVMALREFIRKKK